MPWVDQPLEKSDEIDIDWPNYYEQRFTFYKLLKNDKKPDKKHSSGK